MADVTLSEWTIAIGQIGKPHGLHGEVSVKPITDRIERFDDLDEVGIFPTSGSPWVGRVKGFRRVRDRAHIRLAGIPDRTAAEKLRGAYLRVRPDMRYELAEGEHWVEDLIGLEAVTEDGTTLGSVREVLSLPANDVYVTEHCLIPAIEDVLVSIDLEAGKMVVRPIAGLAPELGI